MELGWILVHIMWVCHCPWWFSLYSSLSSGVLCRKQSVSVPTCCLRWVCVDVWENICLSPQCLWFLGRGGLSHLTFSWYIWSCLYPSWGVDIPGPCLCPESWQNSCALVGFWSRWFCRLLLTNPIQFGTPMWMVERGGPLQCKVWWWSHVFPWYHGPVSVCPLCYIGALVRCRWVFHHIFFSLVWSQCYQGLCGAPVGVVALMRARVSV